MKSEGRSIVRVACPFRVKNRRNEEDEIFRQRREQERGQREDKKEHLTKTPIAERSNLGIALTYMQQQRIANEVEEVKEIIDLIQLEKTNGLLVGLEATTMFYTIIYGSAPNEVRGENTANPDNADFVAIKFSKRLRHHPLAQLFL